MAKKLAKADIAEIEDDITYQDLVDALPPNLQKVVNHKTVKQLNLLLEDEALQHNFRDSLLGYTSVLRGHKYKLQDYFNAVQFVCYKNLGDTNIEAYRKVFPGRYQKHTEDQVPKARVHRYVSAYSNSQLVQDVLAASSLPVHFMFRDVHAEAIMTQAEIMRSAKSDKVRSDAADSLMKHLKPPETLKTETTLKYSMDDESKDAMAALYKATSDLAETQRKVIDVQGTDSLRDIASGRLIEADTYEDDD